MITLIKNANVFAPDAQGLKDIVVAGEAVVDVVAAGAANVDGVEVNVVDVAGAAVIPGLIDAHVHVTGGGGESGPATRVPPIMLSSLTTAGITSVVGVLGTDCTTRTMRDLVGRTLGLRAEGLSAWCWTGGYALPVGTLTGAVRDDIAFVDPIIGVGELAISDHRSSQPTFDELARIAADCHVGGLMTLKAGVMHLHLGDGARGLSLIRRLLDETELPARVFHPTHVNRQRRLFEEAIELVRRGCTVDVTAFDPGDDGISVEDCVERFVADGLPLSQLTVSSDGAGCLPTFNAQGELIHGHRPPADDDGSAAGFAHAGPQPAHRVAAFLQQRRRPVAFARQRPHRRRRQRRPRRPRTSASGSIGDGSGALYDERRRCRRCWHV